MFSATSRLKFHSFGRFIAIGLKGRTENEHFVKVDLKAKSREMY